MAVVPFLLVDQRSAPLQSGRSESPARAGINEESAKNQKLPKLPGFINSCALAFSTRTSLLNLQRRVPPRHLSVSSTAEG